MMRRHVETAADMAIATNAAKLVHKLTLKVGGSFITISAAGVQMVAPSISLNGGAAPLVGTPLTLLGVMKPIGAVMATARNKVAAASKLCRARQKK